MEKSAEKYVALHNLGCKVNAYELEGTAERLISAGYTVVPFEEKADYYIVNTCSVTNIADRKSRQMLHRAKKLNPDAVIIAMGCYVDTHGTDVVCAADADIAVPNSEKENIAEILRAWEESHEKESAGREAESADACGSHSRLRQSTGNDGSLHHIPGEGIHTRKFLKVQDGCNMFCSYCIIPYARGRIKSRSIKDVLAEVKECTDNGCREFVLTGIHLSSYGKDRKEDGEDLLKLIEAVAGISDVKRIRLGSLEPGIITDDFVKGLYSIDKLCPHFHLSLQSGSDSVLQRMNRRYTTEEYARCVERLRNEFSDPAMTTDVIVGFPGETKEEFQETFDFIKGIGFYETHIFPYSRRKGTKADKMDMQIDRALKHERLTILKELDRQNRISYEDRHKGKAAEVLFEEEGTGYTREYIRVRCEESDITTGEIRKGTITGRAGENLMKFESAPQIK